MTAVVGIARRLMGRNVRVAVRALIVVASLPALSHAADLLDTISRVKQSVVAVGTYSPTRAPQFEFRGTGFVVGDGSLIATNYHVLPETTSDASREKLAILVTASPGAATQVREVQRVAADEGSDLALLKLPGPALPALELRDSDSVREGQPVLMTGYPIGAVLGPFPATHRGMVAAITPIAIPQRRAADLGSAVIRRLAGGTFLVFQLDATAYPGNSGSPIYDPSTGQVFGIVNMVFVKGTKESALSQPSGITYAVPARHLSELMKTLR